MRISKKRMVAVLGKKAPKPKKITQQQLDGCQNILEALARSEWDDIPEPYFWRYFEDLNYSEIQPDLFRHVFPACLKHWYDTLISNQQMIGNESDFHSGLLRSNALTKLLSESERERLCIFFVDGFLDRLDAERGFDVASQRASHTWIGRFNTLGIIAPIVPAIWQSWWMLDTPGKAICAFRYASGLIYFPGENPLYPPWTAKEGGGGPYLTASDASIFDHAWREENVAYLRRTLSHAFLVERLSQAEEKLRGNASLEEEVRRGNLESDVLQRILVDVRERGDIVAERIGFMLSELPKLSLDLDISYW